MDGVRFVACGREGRSAVSLRTFDEAERDALTQRAQKTWSALRANDFPAEVKLPSLLPGFGSWRRVAAPVTEPVHRLTCVLFRSVSTDEYALLSFPQRHAVDPVDDNDMGVLLAAARDAVVGDFLRVWRWTLDTDPPMGQVAMLFVDRLPLMSEDMQFLSAFTLLGDTYRASADSKRAVLYPAAVHTRSQVDRLLWEASEEARERVADWASSEAVRFVETLPDRMLAEDQGAIRFEVEHLVEEFLDEQYRFDPLGAQRVEFTWPSV